MRLTSFRIRNFKSISDTGRIKISSNDNLTILAGQNESGKSSILEALDFFQNGPKSDFEDTYRRLETFPRITCDFIVDEEDLKELKRISGSLDLVDYASKNGFTLVRGRVDEDDFNRATYITTPELTKLREDAEQKQIGEGGTGFSLYDYLFLRAPKFIFYSSFDENILPSKITKLELPNNQAVKDFEQVFSLKFDALLGEANDAARTKQLEDINERASDNLNKYWSQKIDHEKSEYKFAIGVYPQVANPDDSYVRFFINQGDNYPLHFGQKSKGFQWFSSFNLRLRAHQAGSKNLSDFILLIDEPGQGLHEEAQKDVKRVLDELAGHGVQILFSTHQAQLIKSDDGVDFSRLKLVARSNKEGTKVSNIAQMASQNGFKDALSPVRTALGQINLSIDDFISAKRVVIVEGITDYYYVHAMARLMKIESLIVVPSVGASQVPNVYSILFGWGINAKAILDDDTAGTRSYNLLVKNFFNNEKQTVIKRHILQNKPHKGIEDLFTQKDFLVFADTFVDKTDLTKSNSQLAGTKKEIIARNFQDLVTSKKIKLKNFDEITKREIERILDFIKSE